jgi:hypothetical protein
MYRKFDLFPQIAHVECLKLLDRQVRDLSGLRVPIGGVWKMNLDRAQQEKHMKRWCGIRIWI